MILSKIGKPGRCAGFSMIELLITLLVIAILMGIGGTFILKFSKGMELESEASKVVSYLHQTRDTAINSGNRAVLRFVKEDETTMMRYAGREVTACFRMDDTSGTHGGILDAGSGEFQNGLMNKCLYLEDGESANMGTSIRWGLEEGFSIDFYLKIESLTQEVELVQKSNQFVLSLVPVGTNQAYLKGKAVLEDTSEESCENTRVMIPTGVWKKIGFACINNNLQISIDEAVICETALSGTLSTNTAGNMTLLDASPGFAGRIDEFIISKWGTLSEMALATKMQISALEARIADADPDNDYLDIVFEANGMLAGNSNSTQTLKYKDKNITIHIGFAGNIYKGQL